MLAKIKSFGKGVLAPLSMQVKGQDVFVGSAVGLLGTAAAQTWITPRLAPDAKGNSYLEMVKEYAVMAMPLLAGLGTGYALFLAQKKSARAKGHFVGAVGTGVVLTLHKVLAAKLPLWTGGRLSLSGFGAVQPYAYGRVSPQLGAVSYDPFQRQAMNSYANLSRLENLSAVLEDEDENATL